MVMLTMAKKRVRGLGTSILPSRATLKTEVSLKPITEGLSYYIPHICILMKYPYKGFY